jgi:hypothetical protein
MMKELAWCFQDQDWLNVENSFSTDMPIKNMQKRK